MPPENSESTVTNRAVENLALCVTESADQLATLRDAIDEFREQFTWAVQNERLPHGICPVLKRMAADPAASDWNARLDIVRAGSEGNSHQDHPDHVQPVLDRFLQDADELISKLTEIRTAFHANLRSANHSPLEGGATVKGFSEQLSNQQAAATSPQCDNSSTVSVRGGDPVEFVLDGHEQFGEVLQVDEAAGTADICLVPTMEYVTVDLSVLQPVPVDDDDDESLTDSSPDSDSNVESSSTVNQSLTPLGGRDICEDFEHLNPPGGVPAETQRMWDELIEDFEIRFNEIANSQLELILSALNDVKRELIEALCAHQVPGAQKAGSGQKSLFDEESTHRDSS